MMTALALPPAPITTHVFPDGLSVEFFSKDMINPSTSVLWPISLPDWFSIVLTAPTIFAVSSTSSNKSKTVSL